MSAPQIIIELVERFEENRDQYRAGAYSEAEIRTEFIDPFFEVLGWDIANKKARAEQYKDVVREASVDVEGKAKKPDYEFRIGGTRKFYVEAKKPSINLKDDTGVAFQIRRYAWSAKLSLGIITDFEEFAVYDCRTKPNATDKAGVGRLNYYNYKEYAEKWDEIAGIFSKDSILKGAFDKYAVSDKRRGTLTVDEAFLKEIESWREDLAKNIAIRNKHLTVEQLNYAVQQTIDRIIFLRICEDRGVESYGELQKLTAGKDVYKALLKHFLYADERYNSGLFHFKKEKDIAEDPDDLTPSLTIDDKTIKEIIKRIYYPNCPYEFSVISADILGQVYERFLGKVIRLTEGHQAKVEDKPEVKKAGGVYYTPTYIVDYIVRNTVGELVKGKTPAQVDKLKILDPACGSGSFLIGAYQFLLDWYLEHYRTHEPIKLLKGKAPKLYESSNGYRLTLPERRRILINNIHGVDIDNQAVEVTKLSLLLKVLEGETQRTLFDKRVLPDLSGNIKCGNSLIGSDYFADRLIVDPDELARINPMDWDYAFPETMKSGGFDAVIGNPPYVVIGHDLFDESSIAYLREYEVAQYNADLYHTMIERGITLLSKNGFLGFIVPSPWLTMKNNDKLRKYILDKTRIVELVINNHLVFSPATVNTLILLLQKDHAKTSSTIRVLHVSEKFADNSEVREVSTTVLQEEWLSNPGYVFEIRQVGDVGKLVKKIMKSGVRLDSVARASLGCQAYNRSKHSVADIKNRVFHSDHKAGSEYLPELAGSDVSRYEIHRKRGQWIKYGPWLHDYRTLDWLTGPRILIREIAGTPPYRIQACYVEETYCNYKTILNVSPSIDTTISMKYLTGIINSRLSSFVYPFLSNKLVTGQFPRLSVGDLRAMPIKSPELLDEHDRKTHDQIVGLVDTEIRLRLNARTTRTPASLDVLKRQIDATDRQIDQLVYELYGLTAEEIKIVEGEM